MHTLHVKINTEYYKTILIPRKKVTPPWVIKLTTCRYIERKQTDTHMYINVIIKWIFNHFPRFFFFVFVSRTFVGHGYAEHRNWFAKQNAGGGRMGYTSRVNHSSLAAGSTCAVNDFAAGNGFAPRCQCRHSARTIEVRYCRLQPTPSPLLVAVASPTAALLTATSSGRASLPETLGRKRLCRSHFQHL